jgi:tetratricopeptide (TPR) repeat protein
LELDPDNVSNYDSRGFSYLGKDELDRAVADFDQAIELDPNNAVSYLSRGYTYMEKGDRDRAIADFDRAIGQI